MGSEMCIRDSSKNGVADQEISGEQIVEALESVKLVSAAGSNPGRSDSRATTSSTLFTDGSVKSTITFWQNGRRANSATVGHEVLHAVYTQINPPILDGNGGATPSGWDNFPDEAHQRSFNRAARRLR